MKVISLEDLLEKAMLELEMVDTGTDMCRIHRTGFAEGVRYAYDEIVRQIALDGPDAKVHRPCLHYISGMDTSGNCSNCGRPKYQHL